MKDYFEFLLAQPELADREGAGGESGSEGGESQSVTEQPATDEDGALPPKAQGFFDSWAFPLVMMAVVMYFLMFRGPKKKQKERQKMLDGMQKNARVQTIGGILGTIVDVRDDEVVIKIDEATNSKIRVTRSAISLVIGEGDEKS